MPLAAADPYACFSGPVEQGFINNGWGTADPGLEPRGSPGGHYKPYFVCV